MSSNIDYSMSSAVETVIRCGKCGAKLGEVEDFIGTIKIKCRKCGHLHIETV